MMKNSFYEENLKIYQSEETSKFEQIKNIEFILENEKKKSSAMLTIKEDQISKLINEIEGYRKLISNFKIEASQFMLKIKNLEQTIQDNELKNSEENQILQNEVKEKDLELLKISKSKASLEILNKKLYEIKSQLEEKISENEKKIDESENIQINLLTKQSELLENLKKNSENLEKTLKKLESKSQKNKKLKSEIKELNKNVSSVKNSMLDLKDSFEKRLIEKEEEISAKSSEIEHCKFEIDKLSIELNNQKLTSTGSDSNISRMNIELNEEIKRYKLNEKKINRSLLQANNYNEDLKASLMAIERKILVITEENEILRQKISELEENLERSEKKNNFLMNELDENLEKIKEIKEENNDLKQTLAKNESLINDLNFKIFLQEEDINQEKNIEKDMENMIEKDLNQIENQEQYIQKLKNDNSKLGLIINSLEKKIDSECEKFEFLMQEKENHTKSLLGEIQDYKNKTNFLLQQINMNKENYVKNEEGHIKTIDDLNECLQQIKNNFEELRIENKGLNDYISELANKNSDLECESRASIEHMKNQEKNFIEKEEKYEEICKNYQEEIFKLQIEIKALQKNIEEYRSLMTDSGVFDINELREKNIQLETKLILLQYQEEKDKSEIDKLQESNLQKINQYKIEVLEKDIEEKSQEIENLLKKIENLKAEERRLKLFIYCKGWTI